MPKGIYPRLPRPRRSLADRLWSKVDRSGGPDACWPFTGYCDEDGYGHLRAIEKGDPTLAHRIAYELENGPLGDRCARHKCDNPPCCNPAHLIPGTNADNVADKVARGRQAAGPAHGLKIRGENHGNAKLTVDAVRRIRELAASGTSHEEIAIVFSISPKYVPLILSGRRWGWAA